MNDRELEQLHKDLSAAPPGVAMRLGIDGNTPDDIALRWQRWNELSDYETRMRHENYELRMRGEPGDLNREPDVRIFGLAAVGTAYGDLDRIESSGVLISQMEDHLDTGRAEVSPEVLERVVNAAIEDARNSDRIVRVPGRGEAAQWWRVERDEYQSERENGTGPMDLVEADEAVVLLRKRVVDALVHGQALAQDPGRRAEAERYIKREIAMADEHVELAARKYHSAANEFRETKRHESTNEATWELFDANERVAASRAAALLAYSAALHQASQRKAPFMACVRRSLSERFPHEERDIMATEAGRLTEASSVEAALRLTPKDPANWYPDKDGMDERVDAFVNAGRDRDRLDWDEMVALRHVPRTPTLRGQGLAMSCYDVISQEQKELSDRWRRLSSVERSVVDDGRVNSVRAHEYSTMNGIPAMPALTGADQTREPHESMGVQKSMVDKAADPTSVYSVAPPTPTLAPEAAVDMGK